MTDRWPWLTFAGLGAFHGLNPAMGWLWPALLRTSPGAGGGREGKTGPLAATLAGVGIHTLAMLATTAIIAALIYEWLGLALLRRAWLNVDALWVAALATTGALLLA